MKPALWLLDKQSTKAHWLELLDPEGWHSAIVKQDGCVDLRVYHNVPLQGSDEPKHMQLVDYIHICDLDNMIDRLQALKQEALLHFGEDWK